MRDITIQAAALLGCMLLAGPAVAGEWAPGAFAGGRASYGPTQEPTAVLELSFRKPFKDWKPFYHQFAVGLWRRKELVIPPDIIFITPPEIPVVTSYHASYSVGIRSPGRFYVNFSHGFGFIDQPTAHLGTRYQFFTSAGFGYSGEHTSIECGVRHISNGSRYFNTPETNSGEDFVVCGLTALLGRR